MMQDSLLGPDAELPEPTRSAGLARLRAFTPAMGRKYATARNHDFGPHDRSNVSALSAHVRRRLITEAELVGAALSAHGLEAAETFIQEVCWRTYWKGWLEQRPSVWRSYRSGVDQDLSRLGECDAMRARYDAAIEARTGIECFDVWAGELVETGYLHNHARMWFASIWIYTLELPWRLGADFFLRHLIDADPASNTLSWRWVCGLHTAGKTYLARAGNINKYSGGRFEMQGYDLASKAPALGAPDHPAPSLPAPASPPDPSRPTLLLIHEEDGLVEDWSVSAVEVRGAVAIDALDHGASPPSGRAAKAFRTRQPVRRPIWASRLRRWSMSTSSLTLRDPSGRPSSSPCAPMSGRSPTPLDLTATRSTPPASGLRSLNVAGTEPSAPMPIAASSS